MFVKYNSEMFIYRSRIRTPPETNVGSGTWLFRNNWHNLENYTSWKKTETNNNRFGNIHSMVSAQSWAILNSSCCRGRQTQKRTFLLQQPLSIGNASVTNNVRKSMLVPTYVSQGVTKHMHDDLKSSRSKFGLRSRLRSHLNGLYVIRCVWTTQKHRYPFIILYFVYQKLLLKTCWWPLMIVCGLCNSH